MYTHRILTSAALLIAGATASFAQSVTSAHSGLLHYFDGAVSIDGKAVDYKPGSFLQIKENSTLKTEQGRAEVLLTPGVYMRLGENTEIKMLDNRLLSTRVQFLAGSAMLESDDPGASVKDPAVTIIYKDYQLQPLKYGIFELTSDPAQMKVYKGEANADITGSTKTTVKEGHLVVLAAALPTEKFDEKQADDLYLWARDRSAALSAANMASARSLSANGYSLNSLYTGGMYPGLGFNSGFAGGWYLNPMLGMYTYMPYAGTYWSPFGYGFFSPGSIYDFYTPGGYTWYGGGGARTTTFVPQPINGTTVRTAGNGGGPISGAPGRLTGGHSGLTVPVAGAGSHTVASARGGAFSPAMARPSFGGGAAGGSRGFGGSNNNSGFGASNSAANSSFGGISRGASSGGGGFSGASGGGGGAASAGGARGGGGGGVSAGGGRAR